MICAALDALFRLFPSYSLLNEQIHGMHRHSSRAGTSYDVEDASMSHKVNELYKRRVRVRKRVRAVVREVEEKKKEVARGVGKRQKPQKAKSAYMFFSEEKGSAVSAGLGKGAPLGSVGKALGTAWAQLDRAGRAPYEALAAADSAKLKEEKEAAAEAASEVAAAVAAEAAAGVAAEAAAAALVEEEEGSAAAAPKRRQHAVSLHQRKADSQFGAEILLADLPAYSFDAVSAMDGLPTVRALLKKGKGVRNREARQRQIRAQEAKEQRLRRNKVTNEDWANKAAAAAKRIRHDTTFTDPATRQRVADRERLASFDFWSQLNKPDMFKALPTTLPILWEKVKGMGITHKNKMIPLIKPHLSTVALIASKKRGNSLSRADVRDLDRQQRLALFVILDSEGGKLLSAAREGRERTKECIKALFETCGTLCDREIVRRVRDPEVEEDDVVEAAGGDDDDDDSAAAEEDEALPAPRRSARTAPRGGCGAVVAGDGAAAAAAGGLA